MYSEVYGRTHSDIDTNSSNCFLLLTSETVRYMAKGEWGVYEIRVTFITRVTFTFAFFVTLGSPQITAHRRKPLLSSNFN